MAAKTTQAMLTYMRRTYSSTVFKSNVADRYTAAYKGSPHNVQCAQQDVFNSGVGID